MNAGENTIRPSSADLSVNCLGSRRAQKRYPKGDTPETIEGTNAHWVTAQLLLTGIMPDTLPDGGEVTDEMEEGAELAVELIESWIGDDFELLAGLHVEEWLDISHIHPDNSGTPDYWLFDKKRTTLHIADYKFGRVEVNPKTSWQMKNYYAGIAKAIGLDGLTDQLVTVIFYIIQPRFYRGSKIRTFKCLASDLRGAVNYMAARYAEGDAENAPCTSGEWCLYCSASHACDTLHEASQAAIDRSMMVPLRELTPLELDHELLQLETAVERANSRIKGLRAEGEYLLRKGEVLPNYGMIPVVGRLSWTIPTEEVLAIGELEGINLEKPRKPVTPTQAKAAKLPAEYIELYADRTKKGLAMARIQGDLAESIFE